MSEQFYDPTIGQEATEGTETAETNTDVVDTPDTQTDTTDEGTQEQETQQEETVYAPIKIKYNHEEKEIPYEEAIQHIQKGMNYDKVNEKYTALQSDPRLSFVENLAKQYNMSPTEYIEAVNQAAEEEKLNNLIENNIPPELAQEIMENKKFREKYEAVQQEQQAAEADKKQYQEFMDKFPGVTGEHIKPETWDTVHKGTPLKYAYMEQLLEEKNRASEVKQNNEKVKQATTGSATGQGGKAVDGHITQETFIQNRGNQAWVNKNYKQIQASIPKWS